jgi:hypothetical protein
MDGMITPNDFVRAIREEWRDGFVFGILLAICVYVLVECWRRL